MKPPPIEHDLAHEMANRACDAGDWRTAVEMLERAQRGESSGVASSLRTANRLFNLRRKIPLTHQEQQVLDACMFGAMKTQLADSTGLSAGAVRRLVGTLEERGHLRQSRVPEHDGGRLQTLYTREGPED